MTWYTFKQNNSGGKYLIDDMVDILIVVEETTIKKAIKRARSITKNHRVYCKCCGDRWDFEEFQIDVHDEKPVDLVHPAILYALDGSRAKLPGPTKNPSPRKSSLDLKFTGMRGGSTEFVMSHFLGNIDSILHAGRVELPPLVDLKEFYDVFSQEN
ncbi:hypothetical protein D3C77_24690 [compost metagenome]